MKKTPVYKILYQDETIVAVNKMPGVAVLPGRGRKESVLTFLESDPALKGVKPLAVHRVDADTSGIIIFALTAEAQKHLNGQFRERVLVKEHWALVRGTPLNESGSIDMLVGIDPKDKTRVTIRGNEGKKARTKWVVGQRFAGVTLLRVFPVTSRRHQIRVHLKAIGHPLAVDPLYGGESLKLSEFKRRFKLGKFQEERPMMQRLSLHAYSLTFVHPTTGVEMVLKAELPKDFRGALEALGKWASKI
jgi:23S rRNA pseudouridine955/2504/2580 synthase/23S rRNA pseudouridine1911/1915/1917 synthase